MMKRLREFKRRSAGRKSELRFRVNGARRVFVFDSSYRRKYEARHRAAVLRNRGYYARVKEVKTSAGIRFYVYYRQKSPWRKP